MDVWSLAVKEGLKSGDDTNTHHFAFENHNDACASSTNLFLPPQIPLSYLSPTLDLLSQ